MICATFRFASALPRLCIALLALLLPSAAKADVTIYVAYAETERPGIYFPNPWRGSPNTAFFGSAGPFYDAGAILIRNNGPGNVTLGPGAYIDGFLNGASFQLWDSYIGAGTVIAPGQNLILTQTAASGTNFDSSDQPIQFQPSAAIPHVHLTLNGVLQDYADTAQIINAGGYDAGDINNRDESVQWRPIGTFRYLYPGGTTIGAAPVSTWHNDNFRSGANPNELTLLPAYVHSSTFGKIFSQPVEGQIYAQPLFMPGIAIAGKGTHNIVLVATEHNYIYAFDAETNEGTNAAYLWRTDLGPSTPAADICANNIAPEFGVTGTPVIDPATNTLYALSKNKISGVYYNRLHAIDITNGQERAGSPVTVQASAPGLGEGGDGMGNVLFDDLHEFQRPGLLLLNGIVYVCWSSHCDYTPYHGWVIGYDAKTLAEKGVWNTSPNGVSVAGQQPAGAGIWMTGAAPAADADSLFVITGNGRFNANKGGTEYGDSVVKLTPVRNLLPVADYFTPYDQQYLDDQDVDLGSSGAMLLPDQPGAHPHLLVCTTKTGKIYLIDRDTGKMSKFHAGGDQIVQSISNANGGAWSSLAYYNGRVYTQGNGDVMRAFALNNGILNTTPAAISTTAFSYPGATPCISYDATSANPDSTAIAWAIENAGGTAVLHAYAATDLSELYNSSQVPGRDYAGSYLNFTVPLIADGRVFVGTASQLSVYSGGYWVGAPTFSPNGGAISPGQPITINSPTIFAKTYYTLDGSEPTQNSTLYTNPITISASATIKARAFKLDYFPSEIASAGFNYIPAPPLPPANLTAGGADHSVFLNWTAGQYAVTYNVKRSLSANGTFTAIASGVTGTTYTDAGLTNGTTYYYKVSSSNSLGTSADSNIASATPTPPIIGNGTGLTGQYFVDPGNDTFFNALTFARTDASINFDWNGAAPAPGVPGSNFSARWTGKVLAPVSGPFTFTATADDGIRLWVNSQLLIDAWVYQAATAYSGTINLNAGQQYDIRMEYFQGGGGAVAHLAWAYAGQIAAIIPQTQLYPAAYPAERPDQSHGDGGKSGRHALNWTPGFYDQTYTIKRSLSANGSFTTVASGVTSTGYQDSGLVNGVTYYYVVSGANAYGESAASNLVSAAPKQSSAIGDGLAANYYAGDAADFSPETGTPFLTTIDGMINFTVDNTVSYSPQAWDAGIPHDHYTAVWTGQLLAPATGSYTFATVTDDGIRLSLDTGAGLNPLFANPTYHAPTTDASGPIALTAGQQYPVKVEFFQGTGGATMQLLWTLPDGTTQIIPQAQLFSRSVNLPAAPANLKAAPAARTVRLTWDAVPGAVSYYVKRSAAVAGPYATIAAGVTATTYLDAGLTGGASYYYVVSAATATAEGPDSRAVAAPLPYGIAGRIALEGVDDLTAIDSRAPVGVFEFQFRAPGTLTAAHTVTAALIPMGKGSPFGTYFITGIPVGVYDIAIKGSKNLRVLLAGRQVSRSADLPDVLLPCGDANNDNSVDSSDFGVLIGVYNSTASVPGSGYDPAADFNFDGLVDSADFGLLIGEFNNLGAD